MINRNLFSFVLEKLKADKEGETLWFFGGQVILFILSIVVVKLMSGLGTDDYGVYALALTFVAFLGMTIYDPLSQAFNRFFYEYYNSPGAGVFNSFIIGFANSGAIIFLSIAALVSVVAWYTAGLGALLVFLSAGFFVVGLKFSMYFNNFLNLLRKRKNNSILQALEKLVFVLFLAAVISTSYFSLEIVLFVYGAISFFFGGMKYLVILKYLKCESWFRIIPEGEKGREIKNKIFGFSWPFVIWGLAGWLQINGEKWIIAEYLSNSDVGIYALMMNVTNALLAFPSVYLNEFMMPMIFRNFSEPGEGRSAEQGHRYINLLIVIVLFLLIFAALFTWFFGVEIITLLSSESFTTYWYLLPVLCIGTGLFYLGQSMTMLGLALNRPKVYLAPKIIFGISAVILNFILIRIWGISGIAFSMMTIGLLYSGAVYFINRKLAGEGIKE